jgi:hypothetical protein
VNNWAVRIYRLAAIITGMALCRHKIVESVYANRGVGRGEVTFGRSDIDLTVIVRNPNPDSGDGVGLYSLYQWFGILRRINPAVTHLLVNDASGLDRWMRIDSYNGSIERRSLLLLAGKPVPMPQIPVRHEDAIRRVAFWNDRFFPAAVQQRSRRNLRKIAIEVWKAWAVARGLVAEPYLTLHEAEQNARLHLSESALPEASPDPRHATGFIMKLAALLHDEFFPPLKKLQETLVFQIRMLPRSRSRILVVLPHPESAVPAAAYEKQSILVTPEMLHLYIHYLNPFADWTLPSELRRLGFTPPTHPEFLRACLFHGQDSMWRRPGFVSKDTWIPGTGFAFNQYSTPYLRDGNIPPPMPEDKVRAILENNSTCREFYARDFASFYSESMEQMSVLQQLQNTPAIKSKAFA